MKQIKRIYYCFRINIKKLNYIQRQNPSQEDKKITLKVIEAMKLLDCELIDHVIVSGNNYYSFIDDGLL